MDANFSVSEPLQNSRSRITHGRQLVIRWLITTLHGSPVRQRFRSQPNNRGCLTAADQVGWQASPRDRFLFRLRCFFHFVIRYCPGCLVTSSVVAGLLSDVRQVSIRNTSELLRIISELSETVEQRLAADNVTALKIF